MDKAMARRLREGSQSRPGSISLHNSGLRTVISSSSRPLGFEQGASFLRTSLTVTEKRKRPAPDLHHTISEDCSDDRELRRKRLCALRDRSQDTETPSRESSSRTHRPEKAPLLSEPLPMASAVRVAWTASELQQTYVKAKQLIESGASPSDPEYIQASHLLQSLQQNSSMLKAQQAFQQQQEQQQEPQPQQRQQQRMLQLQRPQLSNPIPRQATESKDILCRNVLIYGDCRLEDQGCPFNHDITKRASSPQPDLGIRSEKKVPGVAASVKAATEWSNADIPSLAFGTPLTQRYHNQAPGAVAQRSFLAPQPVASKKHKCPYCDVEFTRHHNLKSHLLTHSQEKPYVCQTCNVRFRRLHDLKRHTKLHIVKRLHACPTCNRSFAREDALARHRKGNGGCGRLPVPDLLSPLSDSFFDRDDTDPGIGLQVSEEMNRLRYAREMRELARLPGFSSTRGYGAPRAMTHGELNYITSEDLDLDGLDVNPKDKAVSMKTLFGGTKPMILENVSRVAPPRPVNRATRSSQLFQLAT